MANDRINNQYLRSFFEIQEGPEGDAEIEEIQSKLQRLQFSHGQDICKIDDEADGMYFLESGAAVVLDRDGEQINMMNVGQYFGEYAVLSGQRRLSTVRSHGKTVVYRLSPDDMMEILRKHPSVYGELMKRIYAQVTQKHRQLVMLSRMKRGVLRHPDSQLPMTPRRMLIQYGILALIFILSAIFVPQGSAMPIFIFPMVLMVVYVLITHRTLESLIVASLYATLLIWRSNIVTHYTDAFLVTFGSEDSAYTIFVMSLLGSFVTLIEASGAVTSFKKLTMRKVKSARGFRYFMLFILAVTSIDDCLSTMCASEGTNTSAEEQRVHCEDRSLILSFLPTVLCTFIPISIWGVFIIGTLQPAAGSDALGLFLKSIPFNFFSIVVVLAMILHCGGRLPKINQIKNADSRVREGGPLWPPGSERYLLRDESEVWGRIINLIIPVIVLAVTSITLRSIAYRSFTVDCTYGLTASILVMFFLYCGQRLMSPDQFVDHMITGIQSMILPTLLYLLTMCFTAMLNEQALGEVFNGAVMLLRPVAPILPAALYLVSMLLAMALGSSWAMYVIAFPAAIHIAAVVGISAPLCIGAVCAAGIAGEKCCTFISDDDSVGEAIGCDPQAVFKIRIPYAFAFSLVSLVLYLIAGFLFR